MKKLALLGAVVLAVSFISYNMAECGIADGTPPDRIDIGVTFEYLQQGDEEVAIATLEPDALEHMLALGRAKVKKTTYLLPAKEMFENILISIAENEDTTIDEKIGLIEQLGNLIKDVTIELTDKEDQLYSIIDEVAQNHEVSTTVGRVIFSLRIDAMSSDLFQKILDNPDILNTIKEGMMTM
ncbi:MAG: hypothetical protein P9M06_03450 [Candidatus Saelkia tenebricola]|nr:hypothetical protein [Candidatus Saelkia tenebricola]